MLDNPNTHRNCSPCCGNTNIRRRNSLPTPSALKPTFRRRSTATTKFISDSPLTSTSSSSTSTSRSSSLSARTKNGYKAVPLIPFPKKDILCSTVSTLSTLPLPEVVYQGHNRWYSLRLVSSKLNKSNPYVGSFRHSPPTTLRDLRFLRTTATFANAASTTTSTPLSPSLLLNNRTTSWTPTATSMSMTTTTESRSLYHSLNLDSYNSRFGNKVTPIADVLRSTTSTNRSKDDDVQYEKDECKMMHLLSKLLLSYVMSDISNHSESSKYQNNANNYKKKRQKERMKVPYSKKKRTNNCADRSAFFTEKNKTNKWCDNVNGKCEVNCCSNNPYCVSGRLRGGSPQQLEHAWSNASNRSNSGSTTESATLRIVCGIASWFMQLDQSVPFISDEHSMMPIISDATQMTKVAAEENLQVSNATMARSNDSDCDESSLSSDSDGNSMSSSSLSSVSAHTKEDSSSYASYDNYDTFYGSRTVPDDDQRKYTNNQDRHTKSSMQPLHPTSIAPPTHSEMPLDTVIMATNHTKTPTTIMDTSCISMLSSVMTVPSQTGQHRTDYDTITQMDIVRMARVASRHLDVASIIRLPIITFEKKLNHSEIVNEAEAIDDMQGKQEQNEMTSKFISDDDTATRFRSSTAGEFSWMLVHKALGDGDCVNVDVSSLDSSSSPGQSETAATVEPVGRRDSKHVTSTTRHGDRDGKATTVNTSLLDDSCVICQEQFVNRDRLRVLPCRHCFHIGCIDKWLSGSVSMYDCYTAGCPTCKKAPVVVPKSPFVPENISIGTAITTSKTKTFLTNKECNRNIHNNTRHAETIIMSADGEEVDNNDLTTASHSFDYDYLGESTDGSVPSWAFARLGVAMAMETKLP